MWRQANGTTVKLLAITGVIGLIILMLILLDWLARQLLDIETGEVAKWFITLFTIVIGGGAGVKYVSGLEVTKKEAERDDS
jgi:hypothetical protein